ncbi:MAG: M55 family metallopeptidase [Clostridia bacterium]|nr:M55 family metallopeptidase [Clostridia bacterium]
MKVFISADIEGTTLTNAWNQTHPVTDLATAKMHTQQMTAEVKAACEGAIAAGATEILIKDAHGPAINIDPTQLPDCAQIIRSWNGHPYAMAYGVDRSFDAAMFVGYHSAAGRRGNPLSHTYSTKTTSVTLNGMICTEFLLFSWCCALEGVPSVLLTGDKMLTEDSLAQNIHPKLKTVAVKDGLGGMIRCLHPKVACDRIRAAAEEALRQDLSDALCKLPKHFVLELSYKEHRDAVRYSWFPGFKLVGDRTIRLETDNYLDVLGCVSYVF